MLYSPRELKERLDGLELIYHGATTFEEMKKQLSKENESSIIFWKNGIFSNEVLVHEVSRSSKDALDIINPKFHECFGVDYIINMERYAKPGIAEKGACREYFNIKSRKWDTEGLIISTKS